jgi:TetR/AcrR family transcriptional regulator, transcriptional repressor for nem operon
MEISMSPHSEAEIEKVANSIKELFWRRGYEDTSIEDVVKATGFNRYNLYKEFGGKRELFLAALDAYCLERKNVFLSSLNDPDTPPMDAIRRVYEFAITEMAEHGNGCLMCNVANEGDSRDPVISERLQCYLDEIKLAHVYALQRASERGELNPAMTPEQGASLLFALKFGLGVHSKNGASRDAMLDILNTTMMLLKQEKPQ